MEQVKKEKTETNVKVELVDSYEAISYPLKCEVKQENIKRTSSRQTKPKSTISADDIKESPTKRKIKRFRCGKCRKEKSFTTLKQLNRHLLSAHCKKNPEVIICEICSALVTSEGYYKRHLKTKHPSVPKTFICDYDGRTFTSKDYLRTHIDRHRKHQILTCKTCMKTYVSRFTFRRHLKMVKLCLN